jgi:hypothetical protein
MNLNSGGALLEYRDLHEADACNREQYLKRGVHRDAVRDTSETLRVASETLPRHFGGHPRPSEAIRGLQRHPHRILGKKGGLVGAVGAVRPATRH